MRFVMMVRVLAACSIRFIAPSLLIASALLPASSLLYLRFRSDVLPAKSSVQTLAIVLPLATFLLVIFLWQARHRIRHLQAKEREAVRSGSLDPLSRLPNRAAFDGILERAVADCSHEAPIALFIIDIDRFKTVNDSHGHQAGDRLIVGIAERIKRIIHDTDCLARVGGDEFALMLVDTDGLAQCAAMAHRIHDALLAPIDTGAAQVFVTLSVGVALCPQDGDTHLTLSAAADLALYRAKSEGRNRFALFDKTMERDLRLGMTIEADMRRAIRNEELTLLYQPLMASCGTRMQGLEALVRWQHPERGLMSPEEFIPLAEIRGLIVPLGEWVLRRACLDAKRWPGLRIAVNVSPVQFRQRGFVQKVKAIIDQTGIDPARLDLELTEGVLIQDEEQAEAVIMDLRALGVRMGLDDFGSGYSSLIYLRRFAFDKIKIDRGFLQALEMSGEGAIMLEYIVSLGHALGLTVTAEGVERQDQLDFLRALGCDEMQGYHFSPPVPADAIDERVSMDTWMGRPDAVDPGREPVGSNPRGFVAAQVVLQAVPQSAVEVAGGLKVDGAVNAA